jgi:hypothetical protein
MHFLPLQHKVSASATRSRTMQKLRIENKSYKTVSFNGFDMAAFE